MKPQSKNVLLGLAGFISVAIYWAIVINISLTYIDTTVPLFLVLIIPLIVFFSVKRQIKTGLDNLWFYKGVTIGLSVSFLIMIIYPFILIGSCFMMFP